MSNIFNEFLERWHKYKNNHPYFHTGCEEVLMVMKERDGLREHQADGIDKYPEETTTHNQCGQYSPVGVLEYFLRVLNRLPPPFVYRYYAAINLLYIFNMRRKKHGNPCQ